MRRINQILWRMAAAMYPVVVPTVVGITSAAQTEGGAITHTVTLNTNVVGMPAVYPFSITSITASAGSDYNATPTFGSSGVTLIGGNITVPVGVLSFPIIVATSQDTVFEGTESYSITVGGMTNTVNILDDDAAPTVLSVSSASASEGNSVIHLITISGTAQAARTFAIAFTDGTATGGGVDYTSTLANGNFTAGVTIAGGFIAVPPSVTSFYCYVPTSTDALTEGSETYTLTVGGASGVGTITDGYGGPVVYGAPADAGQINTSDTHAGNLYYFNETTGVIGNSGTDSANPTKGLAKLWDYTTYVNPGNVLTAPNDSIFVLARGTTQAGFVVFSDVASGYGNFEIGAYGTGSRPKILFEHNASQNSSTVQGMELKYAGGRVANIDLDMQHTMTFRGTASTAFTPGENVTASPSGATGVYTYYAGGSVHVIQLTGAFTVIGNTDTVTGGTSGATVVVNNNSRSYPAGIICSQTDTVVENTKVSYAMGDGIGIGSGGAGRGNNAIVRNNTVTESCRGQANGAGISEGNGSGLLFESNTVTDCGSTGSNTSHNMYLASLTNSTIRRNWCNMTGDWGNHALIIHNDCSDVLLEENLWDACSNGLGINGGHSYAESFTRITIRRNINRLHGTLQSSPQGQAFQLDSLVDSEVYNNLSYGTMGGYNIKAAGGSGGADALMTNTRFSHETLHNIRYGLIVTGTFGAIPPVFQNGIISSSRTTSSELVLWVDAAALASGFVLRNCIIWAPNATGNTVLWNGTYMTISAWMSLYGAAHGCINANPLFVDAAGGDFRLQAGSPAKLAGYNSGITTDFDGNARNATTPSIGAYE